jgi:glutamate-5-semialdehyde dehydrogenase
MVEGSGGLIGAGEATESPGVAEVRELAKKAKVAARLLAVTSTEQRNRALLAMAQSLMSAQEEILAANAQDMETGRSGGMGAALLDRLELTAPRLKAISEALKDVAGLRDPIGEVVMGFTLPNGLKLSQVRVPLGVIGMIYEARPNVTADAAGLAIKTGNAVILRGGSDAINSNLAITRALAAAAEGSGLPPDSIQSLSWTDRDAANEMMKLSGYIDVLIPRGGAGLIKSVVENARVPVIETGIGNCHVYIDASANPDKARRIVINAKCQRPSVCNAAETLLVHESLAQAALPGLVKELQANGVTVYGDEKVRALGLMVEAASEDDWYKEYLDLKMAVKVVAGLGEAIEHINKYGSMHSEAIVTEDLASAQRFVDEVDAAAVYVNASTRFTDGGQFGFGAEMGISTQKLHVRGPMGLEALTSSKYVVFGDGQIRE